CARAMVYSICPDCSSVLCMVALPNWPLSTSAPSSWSKLVDVSPQAASARSGTEARRIGSLRLIGSLHHIAVGGGEVLLRHFARRALRGLGHIAEQEQLALGRDADAVGRQGQRLAVDRGHQMRGDDDHQLGLRALVFGAAEEG